MLMDEQQTMNSEWVSKLKGVRKNLWNIFLTTSSNIFGIF
jgi:hypothetical protein